MEELELTDDLFYKLQEYIRARNLSANTLRTYSYGLDKLFREHRKLSKNNINQILAKKNKRGQYVYNNPNKRALFSLINKYCASQGIDFSLSLDYKKPQERTLFDIPSFDEIKSLISAVPYPYNLMLRVIYNFGAGLRISEFVRLSWSSECINWGNWLRRGRGDYSCLIKESKRGKSRKVTVPGILMEDLYKYAKETVGLNEMGLPNSQGFMFDFDKGDYKNELFQDDKEKWQIDYVRFVERWMDYHILRKYAPKTIGRKIHMHQLRNSRASYLYNYENKPIEVIQDLLGHKSIETTRVYVKIDFDKIQKQMKGTKSI